MDNQNENNHSIERFKKPSIRIMEPPSRPHIQLSALTPPSRSYNNNISNSTRPLEKRNKVKLKPGHSSLDWNYLVATRGIKGELVTGLDDLRQDATFFEINSKTTIDQFNHRIPPYQIRPPLKINRQILQRHQIWLGEEEVQVNDYWCNIGGKVYCLTKYLEFHPGGIPIILELKDQDILPAFNNHHRWISYEKLLQTCLVGTFVNV